MEKSFDREVGRAIREIRTTLGLSIERFSKMTLIPESELKQIESGILSVSPEKLLKISQISGISVSCIVCNQPLQTVRVMLMAKKRTGLLP